MSAAHPSAGSTTGRAASNASVVGRSTNGVIPGVDPLLGAALRLWKRHPPSIALPVLAGTVDMSGAGGRVVGEMASLEDGGGVGVSTEQFDEEVSRAHRRQVTELEGRIEAYMCRTSLRETWLVEDFMCWLSLLSDFESILLRVTEGSNNAPVQPAQPHSSEMGKRSSIFNRIVNALNSPPQRRAVSSAPSTSTGRPVTVEELYPTSYNGGHKNPFGNHCPQTSSADPSPFLLHLANIQFQEKVLQQRLQRICAQRTAFEDGKRLALQALEAAQAAGNNYTVAKKASASVMTSGAATVPGGGGFITAPTTPMECDEYLANLRMHLELKEEADYTAMTAPAAKQEVVNDTIDSFGCCSDWVLTIPADQSIPIKRTRANIKTFLQWHVLVPLKSTLKTNSRPFQNLQLARESAALKKAELLATAEAAAKQQLLRESSLESIPRHHHHHHTPPLSNGSLAGVDNHSAIFNDLMTVSNFAGSPQDPSGSRESMRYSMEGSMYERMQSMTGGAGDSMMMGGGGTTPPAGGGGRGGDRGEGTPGRDSVANPSSLELMSDRGSVATYYGFGPETGKGTTQPRGFPQHQQRQPRLRISQAERQRMQHDRLQSFAERIRRRYVSAQSVQQCGVEVILRGDPYWSSLPEEINKGYDVRDYCERPPPSSSTTATSSAKTRKPSAAQQALAASHAHYKGLFSDTHAPYEGVLRLFGPGWGAMDGNIIPIVKIQQLDLSSLLTRSQMKELSRRITKSNVSYQTDTPDNRHVSPDSPVNVNSHDDFGVVPHRSISSVSSGVTDGNGGFPGGKPPTITVVLMGKSFFMTKPIRIGAAKYFGYRHDRSDRALQLISDVDPSGRLLQYLTDAVVNIIEQWNTYDVQPPSTRQQQQQVLPSPAALEVSEGDKLGGDTAQSSRNTTPHRRSPSPRPVHHHHSDSQHHLPTQQQQPPVVIAISTSKPPLSANSEGGESADGSSGAGPDGSLEHSFASNSRGAATPMHNQGVRSFAGRSSGMMSRTHSNQPIRISSDVGVSLRGLPDEMGTLRSTSVALPTVEGSTYAGTNVGVATHLAPTKKKTNLVLLDHEAASGNNNHSSSVLDGMGDDTKSLFNEVIHHRPSSLDDSSHRFGNDQTSKEGSGAAAITNVSFLGKLKNVFSTAEGTKQPMADLMADERGGAVNGRSFQDLEGGTIGDDALDSALMFNSELHPKYKRNNDSRVDEETNAIRTNRMIRSRANSVAHTSSPCSTPTSDTSLHRMHATPSSHPNHHSIRPNHPTVMHLEAPSVSDPAAADFEEQEEHFMTQCSMAMDQMQEVVRTIRSCTEHACEKLQNNAISVRRTSFCISLAVESYIHAQLYDGFVFPIFTAMYTNDETQLQTTRSRLLVDPPTSAEFADGCDVDLRKRGSWVNKRTGDRVISPCYFGASKEFWKFDPSPYAGLVESIATMASTPFDKLQRIRALFLLVAEQGQRLSTLYRGRKVDDDDLPESEAFDMNDVTDSRWQEADGQAPVNMCADDMVAMFTVVLVWCGCRELYSQMQYLAVFHSEAAEEDSELEYAYVTFRVAVENIILEGKKKN